MKYYDDRIKYINDQLLQHKNTLARLRPGTPAYTAAQNRALPLLKQRRVLEQQRENLFARMMHNEQVQDQLESMKDHVAMFEATKVRVPWFAVGPLPPPPDRRMYPLSPCRRSPSRRCRRPLAPSSWTLTRYTSCRTRWRTCTTPSTRSRKPSVGSTGSQTRSTRRASVLARFGFLPGWAVLAHGR